MFDISYFLSVYTTVILSLIVQYTVYCCDQFFFVGRFYNVAFRYALHRCQNMLFIFKPVEHNNLCIGMLSYYFPDRVDTVHVGHDNMHCYQTGNSFSLFCNRFFTVRCFGNDDVTVPDQYIMKRTPHRYRIVDNHDFRHTMTSSPTRYTSLFVF